MIRSMIGIMVIIIAMMAPLSSASYGASQIVIRHQYADGVCGVNKTLVGVVALFQCVRDAGDSESYMVCGSNYRYCVSWMYVCGWMDSIHLIMVRCSQL